MKKTILCLLFYFCLTLATAQPKGLNLSVMDSLKKKLGLATQDTVRCRLLNAIIEAETDDNIWPRFNEELKGICELDLKAHPAGDPLHKFYLGYLATAVNNEAYLANLHGDVQTALGLFSKGLELEQQIGNKKGIAASLNNLGSVYQYQGDIARALGLYNKSFALYKELKDKAGMSEALNNLGLLYDEQGDIPLAMDCYHQALAIQESVHDKGEMAILLNNIGALYGQQGEPKKELEYYQKSLKIVEELGNKLVIASSLHNIGSIYQKEGSFAKALEYYHKSYKISEESKNITGMAHCLSSIGLVYSAKGNTAEALEYWRKSLALWEKLNDKQGMALTTNHIAMGLMEIGQIKEAQQLAERSLKLSQDLGFPENIKDVSGTLSKLYAGGGNWKGAYEMHALFKQMNDSITSQSSRKAFLRKTFQHEYEKKAAADSLKALSERRVFDAELRQQKMQRRGLYFGIGFVTLFALFIYNRFRVTQRQKQIIELKEKEAQQQKQIIEEKHKEISDSINYAERIQRSFLATGELLDTHLKDYFVLFRPKDIVSGDFYWGAVLKNGHFAFATADSTGHGVPGAIMSLLNITSLEKAIEQHTGPAEILNHTRATIIERLKKDGSTDGGKDGMDCSLMVFDKERRHLLVAAAQNPVWIVRRKSDGAGENTYELLELGYDKMPVGRHEYNEVSFTQQSVELQPGDMIYGVSDGFADQFGGAKGKKFMHKRLKELLLSIAQKTPAEQKDILVQTLNDWIGELEQVDDITVVGIRIS